MPDINAPNGAGDASTRFLSIRLLVYALALAGIYFVSAFIGIELTREAGGIATFWPANAFLLVVLLRSDSGTWPVYIAACTIANFAANLTFDADAAAALGFTASNMAEAVLGAFLVRRFCRAPFKLNGLRSAACFLIWGALVGPAVGALCGATVLVLSYGSAFSASWSEWWLADAMGIVIFAPVLLAWRQEQLAALKSRIFAIEVASVLLVAIVASATVFTREALTFAYLIIPILLWAAFRLGTFWCAVAGATVAAVALGSHIFSDPSAPMIADRTVADGVLLLQLFLGVAIVSPLAVAILLGERSRVAVALDDSRERLRDFADAGSDWFFETDAQLRFSYLRGRDTDAANGLAETMLGKTLWQIADIDPETNERWWEYVRDINARRDFRSVEIHLPELSGLPRHSRWNGKPIFGPAGEFKGYRGTGRDITEFREQEARLAEIVNNIIEGLVVAGHEGTIESVNPPLETMFGYTAEDLVGQNVGLIMPSLSTGAHDDYLEPYLRIGETRNTDAGNEASGRRKDGTTFPVELAVGEFTMGGKRKYVGVIRDVSERKQAAREREQFLGRFHEAQKVEALGTLARGVAHDFNNALFPIIGLTELTVSTLPNESSAHDTLSKVLTAAYHARDLVGQILAFSRIEPPNRAPVELQPIVRDAISFLRAALPTTIDIVEAFDDSEGFVLADATQIFQVIVNLGSNAQDAMGDSGGVLTIALTKIRPNEQGKKNRAARANRHGFKLTISDTGRGMDEETRARIFEPFFTTKQDARGTGLGLSVVHDIVSSHAGSIEVRSKLGAGSEFDIFLPILDSSSPQTRDSENRPGPFESQRPNDEET